MTSKKKPQCVPWTTEKFIDSAKKVHGDKYDYSKVVYVNSKTKIIIICNTCIYEWLQTPNNHIQGYGCDKCAHDKVCKDLSGTKEHFIKNAILKHGNKFDYSKVVYVNTHTKVAITCKTCNTEFLQTPHNHKDGGYGCPKCGNIRRAIHRTDSKDQFVKKAVIVHGDKFDYSKVVYEKSKSKVTITCKTCNTEFLQKPNDHTQGDGCPECGGTAVSTTEKFIEASKKVHGDKYDYSNVKYIANRFKVDIKCNKCVKVFDQMPTNHLSGNGCPFCRPKHSKISIQYMEYLSISNPGIEYALNPKEHCIKNSMYRADGYIPSKNLVVEFQGCYFHGCPKCYEPEEICSLTKKPYISSFNRGMERKQFILDQGYAYTEVWECEWKRGIKALRTLQKKWTSN